MEGRVSVGQSVVMMVRAPGKAVTIGRSPKRGSYWFHVSKATTIHAFMSTSLTSQMRTPEHLFTGQNIRDSTSSWYRRIMHCKFSYVLFAILMLLISIRRVFLYAGLLIVRIDTGFNRQPHAEHQKQPDKPIK